MYSLRLIRVSFLSHLRIIRFAVNDKCCTFVAHFKLFFMYKPLFNKRQTHLFKRFANKGYALFNSLSKEILIGTLSVATLTHAKANSISIDTELVTDSLEQRMVALDEVTVTGSRAPLTMQQSAKFVTVITRDDINRAAAESINDVLKSVTGVDVRQRGGFGVQTDISINGGTFDQITILLNGINISSPQTGHYNADFPVSLSDIERIEVLEGAASRALGTSAFNGVINIVTRVEPSSGIRISSEGGSFGSFGGDAGVTLRTKSVTNQLSGGYRQSDGGTKNSDFVQRRIYYHGRQSSRNLSLEWQAGVSSQKYGANTFYSASFDNQYDCFSRILASARGEIRNLPCGITLTPTVYWHRDIDHYQLTRGKEGASAGENYHTTDVYGADISANCRWALGTTSVGVDIRKERILSTALGKLLEDESQWREISGSDRFYDHRGERTNTSIFAEHNVVLSNLTVSAGLLLNRNTGLDGRFRMYHGIDVSYRPNTKWKISASWNTALRMPTYTDIYISNVVQQGNQDICPEKNSAVRVGARYSHGSLAVSVGGFYSHGRDMIDWVFETPDSRKYHAMNIGRLDNMGASTDVTLDFGRFMTAPYITKLSLGYAYIYQQHETDRPIARSLYALEYLRNKFTARLDHRIAGRLTASWNLRWQERINGYTPYAKLDCKLMWTAERYALYVKADNITAHRYYDYGTIPQPGLWIMAGGSMKFRL